MLIGTASASNIGASLNSLTADAGQKALEAALAVAAGATGGQALVGVVAFDVITNSVPLLGDAVGQLATVFVKRGSWVARVLPSTGRRLLLPGMFNVDGSELTLLFKKGGAGNTGSRDVLRRNYARANGISTNTLTGIGAEVHHVIPQEFKNHRLLKRLNFQVDSALNALPLRDSFHNGFRTPHRNYNKAIITLLEEVRKSGGTLGSQREKVLAIMTNATSAIVDGRSLARGNTTTAEWLSLLRPAGGR